MISASKRLRPSRVDVRCDQPRCGRTGLKSWFTLRTDHECGHKLCAECLGKEHAKCGCGPLLCPSCLPETYQVAHATQYCEIDEHHGRLQISAEAWIKSPDKHIDPYRWLHIREQEMRHQSVVFSMGYHDPECCDEPYKFISAHINKTDASALGKIGEGFFPLHKCCTVWL